MPPWKPVAGFGDFTGENRLTPRELDLISRWAATRAPEGDPKQIPTPPAAATAAIPTGLVAEMNQPFHVPAEGPDDYRCFVIPLSLPVDRWVNAVAYLPSNRRVVHHALVFADTSGTARRKAAEDGSGSYSCFGGPEFLPVTGLGGWSPGNSVYEAPEGTATLLRKGADLVIQLHFHPTGREEIEQSKVALGFRETPPERRLADIALGSRLIDIPPGDADYRVADHFTTPVDVLVLGVIPHAHYVCRRMSAWALLPNGRRVWLLRIDDWDFQWQDRYRYRHPMRLPAGTRFEMEFSYDNSEANPRNPNRPPQRVRWGAGVADEMAGLHFETTPLNPADLAELNQALWGKLMRSVGGSFRRLP